MNKNNLYIDMTSGVAGDMLLAALIHLGIELNNSTLAEEKDFLLSELVKLNLGEELKLAAHFVKVSGINSVQINFLTPEDDWNAVEAREQKFSSKPNSNQDHPAKHPHRHFSKIKEIILSSNLSDFIKEKSLLAFLIIGRAEAKVHQQDVSKVHFHEVGSLDAILEIVGFFILMERYNIKKIYSSPIVVGSGYVNCQHGKMPVPVPAVLEMLKNSKAPFKKILEPTGELTTPTGLALVLSAIQLDTSTGIQQAKNNFIFPEHQVIFSNGYGAGHKKIPNFTNLVRLILLQEENNLKALDISFSNQFQQDEVVVITTNLDDQSSEEMGLIMEKLFSLGVKDVSYHPINMKKGRLGFCLKIITSKESLAKIEKYLLLETTTLGFRYTTLSRKKLHRQTKEIEIQLPNLFLSDNNSFGNPSINKTKSQTKSYRLLIKESYYKNKCIKYKIEYASLKDVQEKSNHPIHLIRKKVNQYYLNKKDYLS